MSKQAMKAIEQLKQEQPTTNACITIFDEPKQKTTKGTLANWTVAVKDNFVMKDVLSTAGSRILSNYIGVYDATSIRKLYDAGVNFVAKTALDELGMGGTGLTCFTGPVKNPFNPEHQAGGSSSGSAVVVATGAVRMALGSDTGDSVRKPASFCGIVGVKPTYGRISRYGVIPYASSLDHVGYFTSNVMDAAKTLEALSGFDPKDPTSLQQHLEAFSDTLLGDLKGKRIGMFMNVLNHIDHEETHKLFNQLMQRLEAEGAVLVPIHLDDELLRTMLPTYYILANCEATANHANLTGVNFGVQQEADNLDEIMSQSRTAGFNSMLKKRFVIGSYGLKDDNQEKIYRKAQKVRRLLVKELDKALEQVDVLIAPASSYTAPKIEEEDTDKLSFKHLISDNFMVLGNFSGYPSITVPMGTIHGLPIGVNLTSKAYTEAMLFDLAYGFERVSEYTHDVKKVIA